jgi:hypothetical protein
MELSYGKLYVRTYITYYTEESLTPCRTDRCIQLPRKVARDRNGSVDSAMDQPQAYQ